MKSADIIMLQIQRDQYKHDLLAHRDILNLDTQTRLKHMTLHFLKYAGKMVDARETRNVEFLKNILLDTFIICLATANSMNVNLGLSWNYKVKDLRDLSLELANGKVFEDIFDYSLFGLVKISGKMAKSIESTDHLEAGNPRADLEVFIVNLAKIILSSIGMLRVDVEKELVGRWDFVEKKSIFN